MWFFTEEDVEALAEKPVVLNKDSFDFFNPPLEYQQAFTGSSFYLAFMEAAIFLNYVFEQYNRHERSLDFKGKRIVDFGCGWGRMLRHILRKPQFKEAWIYGIEQHDWATRLCQKTLPRTWITRSQAFPPCDLRSDLADVIYSYSVFSHLNQEPHLAWAREFHRLLKPGGYVCVTVEPREFITLCKDYRTGKTPIQNEWHKRLAGAFADEENCYQRFDAGELVFDYTTGGADLESEIYGDAVVPRQFFEKHWTEIGFRLLDWSPVADTPHAQTRVFLQKVR